MFKINKTKSRKYFLLSALFAFSAIFGMLIGNQSLVAQIKNIYGESSDQVAGLNSLMSAVASNDISGVRFFSKAGGSLINQKNIGGATALHIAAREKNLTIVQILIDNGADVNVADNEGWTPLMRAAVMGDADIVELLLSKNADASALNSVNESAIIHATTSGCAKCLNLMFERFNFMKAMPDSALRSQLQDSFVIARNHENEETQIALEKYLDQVVKMSALVKSQVVAEDLGEADKNQNISIVEDNKLSLVTKNSGNFEEKNLAADNNAISKKVKSKFRFVGNSDAVNQGANDKVYEVENEKVSDVKSPIISKKTKFVLVTDPKDASANKPVEKQFKFKPNDSNAVFLLNSKVDNQPVTEVLKSKKFRFSEGPKSAEVVKNSLKIENKKAEEDKPLPIRPISMIEDEIAPIPPVASFKLLKGPEGKKAEIVVEDAKTSKPATEQGDATLLKNSSDSSSPIVPTPVAKSNKGFKLITGPDSKN